MLDEEEDEEFEVEEDFLLLGFSSELSRGFLAFVLVLSSDESLLGSLLTTTTDFKATLRSVELSEDERLLLSFLKEPER